MVVAGACSSDDGGGGSVAPPVVDAGNEDVGPSPDADAATSVQDAAATLPDADAATSVDTGLPVCDCPLGPCVQRERDPAPVCAPPCDAAGGCPAGHVCLTFPGGRRCLAAGDREVGQFCIEPADCAGGLCVWSGGGAALCTTECSGAVDPSCGADRACLPALWPPGAWHCYAVGGLEDGADCLQREAECAGGYCLGQGAAAYCSRVCQPEEAAATCPAGWECGPYEPGHLCCDPFRTRGGCR